jgi:tetratricopeptide (TPR) repeat protein
MMIPYRHLLSFVDRLQTVGVLPFGVLPLITTICICFTGCSKEPTEQEIQRLRTEAAQLADGGKFLDALRRHEELIAAESAIPASGRAIDDRIELAKIELVLGRYRSAREHFIEAAGYQKEIGDHRSEINAMISIGEIYAQSGLLQKSVNQYSSILSLARVMKDSASIVVAETRLGDLQLLLHSYSAALTHFRSAEETARLTGDVRRRIFLLASIAKTNAFLGRRFAVEELWKQSRSLMIRVSQPMTEARILAEFGNCYSVLEDYTLAARFFRNSENVLLSSAGNAETKEGKILKMEIAISCGKLFEQNYEYRLARQYFIDAYTLAKEEALTVQLAPLLCRIADCSFHQSIGQPDNGLTIEAQTHYEQAQSLYIRLGNIEGESEVLWKLGRLKNQEGNKTEAAKFFLRAASLQDSSFYSQVLPVEPTDSRFDPADFSARDKRYVSFLIQQRRNEDALEYLEKRRMQLLWNCISLYPLPETSTDLIRNVSACRRQIDDYRLMSAELLTQLTLDLRNRDQNAIALLQQECAKKRRELYTAMGEFIKNRPEARLLFSSIRPSIRDFLEKIPSDIIFFEFFDTPYTLYLFSVSRDQGVTLSSILQTPSGNSHLFKQKRASLLTGAMKNSNASKIYIIPPLSSSFIALHPPDNGNGEEIHYLPYLQGFVDFRPESRFINSVTACGNPIGKQWSQEFELRSIRNHFKEGTILLGQHATKRELFSARTEFLQLSTELTKSDRTERGYFVLSSGSALSIGDTLFLEELLLVPQNKGVYFSLQNRTEEKLSCLLPLFPLMNGAGTVIVKESPADQNIEKEFSEKFYSSLAAAESPSKAYRDGMNALKGTDTRKSEKRGSERFYYFGK